LQANNETYKFHRMSTLAESIKSTRIHAKLPERNKATIKRMVNDGAKLFLKPLNPGYPIEVFDERCRINGVVIQTLRKF
jgi:SOS-response transcriptional repressor LexA